MDPHAVGWLDPDPGIKHTYIAIIQVIFSLFSHYPEPYPIVKNSTLIFAGMPVLHFESWNPDPDFLENAGFGTGSAFIECGSVTLIRGTGSVKCRRVKIRPQVNTCRVSRMEPVPESGGLEWPQPRRSGRDQRPFSPGQEAQVGPLYTEH
jgi:hypothetical protein